MKLVLFFLFFQFSVGIERERVVDEVLNKLYNHDHLLSADKEAEQIARDNLNRIGLDDPYLHNLWASVEWILIGRELDLKADEQRNISKEKEDKGYKERTERYRQTVHDGLFLAPADAADELTLFVRAALLFDLAKFSARYEKDLLQADREAAEGIKILKKALQIEPNLCQAYLFLGANRFQLSTKVGFFQKPFVWGFSKVYAELSTLDKDVINEKKSIEWLEKAYHCGYSEPIMKKYWLEAAFVLTGAYHELTTKKLKGGYNREGFDLLKKEVPLLRQLADLFPENKDISKILAEKEEQLKDLGRFSKKPE